MKWKEYIDEKGNTTAVFSFKYNDPTNNEVEEFNFTNRENVVEFMKAYSEEYKNIKVELIKISEKGKG